jgi:putative N6-adenine-specific DNA methylase
MAQPLACLAVTPPGLADLTAAELAGIGIPASAAGPHGVAFSCDHAGLARANVELRTAGRVLVRLAEFPARAFYELERKARRIPWSQIIVPELPVRFRVTSRKSKLYHQDGIAERLQSAIQGQQSTAAATNSVFDDEEGSGSEQLFIVRVYRDVVTVSADSSGELLHRRGYRLATAKAPIRETLAAAMLLGAGFREGMAMADPFCGSGTLGIEAALLARRMAPGLRRRFAFEHWPSMDPGHLESVRARAVERILPSAGAPIVGTDRDPGAIRISAENAERAGVAGDVEYRALPLSAARPPAASGLLATNPPYGVRVGDATRLRDLYAAFGRVIREHWSGWRIALLAADQRLLAQTALGFERRWSSTNGGIPVELVLGS